MAIDASFLAEQRTTSALSTHPLMDSWAGFLPDIMAVVNKVTVNTGMCGSFQISVLVLFFNCVPRSGIAVSYSSSIFSFLRSSILFSNFQTSQ